MSLLCSPICAAPSFPFPCNISNTSPHPLPFETIKTKGNGCCTCVPDIHTNQLSQLMPSNGKQIITHETNFYQITTIHYTPPGRACLDQRSFAVVSSAPHCEFTCTSSCIGRTDPFLDYKFVLSAEAKDFIALLAKAISSRG